MGTGEAKSAMPPQARTDAEELGLGNGDDEEPGISEQTTPKDLKPQVPAAGDWQALTRWRGLPEVLP